MKIVNIDHTEFYLTTFPFGVKTTITFTPVDPPSPVKLPVIFYCKGGYLDL